MCEREVRCCSPVAGGLAYYATVASPGVVVSAVQSSTAEPALELPGDLLRPGLQRPENSSLVAPDPMGEHSHSSGVTSDQSTRRMHDD